MGINVHTLDIKFNFEIEAYVAMQNNFIRQQKQNYNELKKIIVQQQKVISDLRNQPPIYLHLPQQQQQYYQQINNQPVHLPSSTTITPLIPIKPPTTNAQHHNTTSTYIPPPTSFTQPTPSAYIPPPTTITNNTQHFILSPPDTISPPSAHSPFTDQSPPTAYSPPAAHSPPTSVLRATLVAKKQKKATMLSVEETKGICWTSLSFGLRTLVRRVVKKRKLEMCTAEGGAEKKFKKFPLDVQETILRHVQESSSEYPSNLKKTINKFIYDDAHYMSMSGKQIQKVPTGRAGGNPPARPGKHKRLPVEFKKSNK